MIPITVSSPDDPEYDPGTDPGTGPEADPGTGSDTADPVEICHFRPDLCFIDTEVEHCRNNTTGPQCESCAEGFYGDATGGSADDCQSCPCPLENNK